MKIETSNQSRGVAIELPPKETQVPTSAPPFKLKTILAPVDFSSCSIKAVQYAEAMAKQFGAELILVHVMQPYVPVADTILVDTDAFIEESREAARKDLESIDTLIDHQIESRVLLRTGQPFREIVQAAEEMNVDLIVISTHGRTGLAHTFMGSTTERVVRHARCPVMVVREREHEFLGGLESTTQRTRE